MAAHAPAGSSGGVGSGSGDAVAGNTDAPVDDVASSPPDTAAAADLSGVGEEASESDLDGVRSRPRSRDALRLSSPGPVREGAVQGSREPGGQVDHAEAGGSDVSMHVAPDQDRRVAGDGVEEQTGDGQVNGGAGGYGGDGEGEGEGDAQMAAAKMSEVDKWREADHTSAIKDKNLMDRYLRFMGRILGVALLSGDPLGVNLDSSFFK